MRVRDVVTRRIAAQCRRFPDLDIQPIETTGLAPRDAALARAIDHAVARRWLTLQAVLASRVRRPWERLEPNVKAPLLVGAAQLLLLDRIPAHAVIHEAVEWSKRHNRSGAAGLVNAVLRGVDQLRVERVDRFDASRADELPLDDGSAWRFSDPVFAAADAGTWSRIAAQTSHPPALLARWAANLDETDAVAVAMHDIVHPPIIVSGLDPAAPECAEHQEPGFHLLGAGRNELPALLARHPSAWVQDPASATPAAASAVLEPKLIIDLCAGLGTKTRQLVRLHPDARIVATDIDETRRRRLRETFQDERAVEVVDFDDLAGLNGQADLLLLDVPCSNTGVLARRVEARYRATDDTIETLAGVQRQIIADALPLLAEAGHVLYATCSIEPGENQEQARWLAHWHHFGVVDERLRLPRGGPGDDPAGYADGGYFALLTRQ